MNPQEMFVTRLRRHRTRSRVTIEEIATHLRIRPELIEGLEKNDLTGWPRGLYSRAWIRAYALAVDLDPVDTVDEFCRLFPQGDRRAGGTIQEIPPSSPRRLIIATSSVTSRAGAAPTKSSRKTPCNHGMRSSASRAVRCGTGLQALTHSVRDAHPAPILELAGISRQR